ncbi:MAG: hypothetical protein ACOY4T_09450 [Pseudomonadota bacterium]
MKIAIAILSQFRRRSHSTEDHFDLRLRSMTSPAATGPRLRRVMPPMLFGFRRHAI